MTLHAVNLRTGMERELGLPGDVYGATRAKLHPDGDRIYAADNGLSPSDFHRYELPDGQESDSRYHGEYGFSGDIWISDDGTRLFARSGDVYRASTDASYDMTYAGSLRSMWDVGGVDTCAAADRVYAIQAEASTAVTVYDIEFLTYRGVHLVPQMEVGSRSFDMGVRWVFARPDGAGIYVIGELPGVSGAFLPFAWTTIEAAVLP